MSSRAAALALACCLALACADDQVEVPAGAVRAPQHGDGWTLVGGRLLLEGSGADVAWSFEYPAGGRFELAGQCAQAGSVSVTVLSVSPEDGTEEVVATPLDGRVSGTLRVAISLLPARERFSRVRLTWSGDSPLVVTRAEALEHDAPERPSIVFLSIDTLAAKHLSLYGYPRATSPNLDAFAEDAIVFEHCLANAPMTTPSYVSQFTGLYPRSFWNEPQAFQERYGRERETWERWMIPEGRWTLAEALQAAGYTTAAFVDNPMAGPEGGLGQGFDVYDMSAAARAKIDPEGGVRTVLPLALEWLDALGPEQPFFLVMNVLDPHAPYWPPEEFQSLFTSDDLVDREHDLPIVFRSWAPFAVLKSVAAGLYGLDGPFPSRAPTAALIDRYDQEVAAVDHAFGELVAALEERGLADEVVWVVSADHGEVMLEHDFHFGHGMHVEPTLHVPFVLRLPRGDQGPRRIDTTVQLVDLAPTLLELAGVTHDRAYLHGRSLFPLLHGEPFPERPVLAQGGHFRGASITDRGWRLVETIPSAGAGMVATLGNVHGRRWMWSRLPELEGLVYGVDDLTGTLESLDFESIVRDARAALGAPHHELFDLNTDPAQEVDLAASEPEMLSRLLEVLRREEQRSRAQYDLLPPAPTAREVGADQLRELQALGYAGED